MTDRMLMLIFALIAAVLFVVCVAIASFLGKRVAKAKKSAFADPVTDGLNFSGLQNEISGLGICDYAVVTAKLKNWPQIIETFGSDDAERVLKYLHGTFKANLSASEPFARLNGSDFCLMIKNRKAEFVSTRLERLAESINSFNKLRDIPYKLDMRFGVYMPKSNDESLFAMCETASQLADSAAEDGECVFENAAKADSSDKRWEFAARIDRSFENKEFLIYLQPKVALGDGRVAGAEALVRWRHPQKGLLASGMFVQALEEYHVIDRMDRFVLETICRKQAEWIKEGLQPCVISVNLSMDTVKKKDFVTEFEKICTKYGVDTKFIEFELNDKLLTEPKQFICDVISRIRERGFKCALSNFGSAAFPIRLLRDLEVDSIKLESGFFGVENNDRKNRFLIEAILKYAAQVGISTVAEGIENVSQIRYLQQSGCDMVQGFCMFKPMPVEEFRNTVYSNGELIYVQLNRDNAGFSAGDEDGGIAMFSYSTFEDRVQFSECFSPTLGGVKEHKNAKALFLKSGIIHENDRKDFMHMLERCKKEGTNVENILRFYVAEGRYEWLTVRMQRVAVLKGEEAIIAGTLVNKNRWKNEVKLWQDKATRDALTGLYNREYFERTVSEALEKGDYERGVLAFIDVDDFKGINDTLGHLVGDDVLRFIAKRLLSEFRHSDVVARYAGDEFVVFVNGISREDMEKRLTHLCESFEYPYRNGSLEHHVHISVGVAVHPEDGTNYRVLLENADSALYYSKEHGKNRFVFYEQGMDASELK
ncbi:MAG: diguanylate cyclase [Oscillospiraceae bacterium]|nr:diguanylate cyclase [Oscillospiraceae bacterium]